MKNGTSFVTICALLVVGGIMLACSPIVSPVTPTRAPSSESMTKTPRESAFDEQEAVGSTPSESEQATAATNASSANPSEMQVYTNTEIGFSIAYPGDWSVSEIGGAGNAVVRLESVQDPNVEPYIHISALEGYTELQDFYDLVEDGCSEDCELSQAQEISIDGKKGLEVAVVHQSGDGTVVRQRALIVIHRDRGFIFAATSPSSSWEKNQPIFGRILSSIELLEPEPPGVVATANGIRIEVTDVLRGTEAIDYAQEQGFYGQVDVPEGWDFLYVRLMMTNVGDVGIPEGDLRLRGLMTDSGGYERAAMVTIEDSSSVLVPSASVHDLGCRITIPKNQEPVLLELRQGSMDPSRWTFDLEATPTHAEVDNTALFESVDKHGVLEHEVPEEYRMTFDNFRFEATENTYDTSKTGAGTFRFVADATFENTGGYDWCFDNLLLYIVATDDKGDARLFSPYLADDQTNMTESQCLAPGLESTGTLRIEWFKFDEFQSDKLHLLLTEGGETGAIQKEPMDTTVITVPSDVPGRFDPSLGS